MDGNYYTLEEYRKLIEASQTDKNDTVIYLYATDATAQFTYVKAAQDKGLQCARDGRPA